MRKTYRYTFNYSNKKDIVCPNCKQKTFTPLLDLRTFQIDARFGLCNRREKCGYSNFPKSNRASERYFNKQQTTLPADNIKVWARREPFTENLLEPRFTQIEPYPGCKAIQRLSIQQLVTLINHFPEVPDKRLQLNILKGKYHSRTEGAFCENPGNYLFFDIDLNTEKQKNLWLLRPSERNKVREILEEDALFVCDTWGGGLCGLLWVNDFNFSNDQKQTHKAIATEIYHLIEDYVEFLTCIKINFDLMQGTFRQVRYFCKQKNKISLNMLPTKFYYDIGVYIEDFYADMNLLAAKEKYELELKSRKK